MGDNSVSDMSGAATRRTLLRGAVIAGVAVPLLGACSDQDTVDSSATTSGPPTTTSGSPTGTSESPTEDTQAPAGGAAAAIATKADVPEGGGVVLGDDGVVITQPQAGTFEGFSSTCTHQGCTLKDVTETINCPCHGSQFSIEDGSVVTGPATKPLPAVKLKVTGQDISLA